MDYSALPTYPDDENDLLIKPLANSDHCDSVFATAFCLSFTLLAMILSNPLAVVFWWCLLCKSIVFCWLVFWKLLTSKVFWLGVSSLALAQVARRLRGTVL
jgi:hypothetical protein